MSDQLLQAQNFSVSVDGETLVNQLNFDLSPTETLGIVGESGSGKSLTSLAIMGLLPSALKPEGYLYFKGQNLLGLDAQAHRELRMKELAMIFQEPMSALNPRMRCGDQVSEVLYILGVKPKAAKKQVLALFEQVRLPRPEAIYGSYPHQLSGGQKQRVVVAIALASKPSLLIADEPTTALDVSVQQSILELLSDLQQEMQMGMLFISHDLAVVQGIAHKVLVMRKGAQIEYGGAEAVFKHPAHAYTKGLLACRPTADTCDLRLPLVEDFLANATHNTIEVSDEQRLSQAKAITEGEILLEAKNLQKYFGKDNEVQAVKDVSFTIHAGESLGLVGESGSGKTTIGRILCGLEQATEGAFFYKGQDLATASRKQWQALNEDIQIIFQDPFSSLNPRIKVGEAIVEVLVHRKKIQPKQAREKAVDLLEKTGLPAKAYDKYPHEFSGGQRQRVGIARALAMQPKLIVCDESVSALDVSVQAQVLNLLNDLKDEFGFSYLFISHDLAVVKYFCSRILVLQKGALVEQGFSEKLYKNPAHAYTKSLIDAMPR